MILISSNNQKMRARDVKRHHSMIIMLCGDQGMEKEVLFRVKNSL